MPKGKEPEIVREVQVATLQVPYSDFQKLVRAAAPPPPITQLRLLNGRWVQQDGTTYAPLQPKATHYTPPLPQVEVKKPEEPF